MLTLILLTLFIGSTVGADDVVFRIRKCCPENQQLSKFLKFKYAQCVDFNLNKYNYLSSVQDPEEVENKPWWFPPEKPIFSSQTEERLKKFPGKVEVTYCRQPCDFEFTSPLPPDYYDFAFYDNGSLLLPENHDHPGDLMFPPDSFCVDSVQADDDVDHRHHNSTPLGIPQDYLLLLCPCQTVTCIKKCCLPGMVLDVSLNDEVGATCVRDANDLWLPDIENEANSTQDFYLLYKNPSCSADENIVWPNLNSDKDEFDYVIKADGTAQIVGETYVIDKYKYCTERVQFDRTGKRANYLLRCTTKKGIHQKQLEASAIFYGTIFIIGAIFLLATLVVYMLLPHRKTTNEKNLISQTLCLFVGYIGLAIAKLGLTKLPHAPCVALGFILQYSFLAAFFWLNVLCFDISLTFSDLRPLSGSVAVRDKKKFVYYSIYGWLCPAAISLVTIVIEFTPNLPSHVLKPEFSEKCWFNNESYAKLAYLFGPMAVLLFVNLIMFVFTTYKIASAQRDAAMVNKNRTDDNQRLVLYFKLFLLMGLSWTTEILSWGIGGPHYYWYVTDIINLLRAVFIFVILCCKQKVYDELKQRFKSTNLYNSKRLTSTRNNSSLTMATNMNFHNASARYQQQQATSQM